MQWIELHQRMIASVHDALNWFTTGAQKKKAKHYDDLTEYNNIFGDNIF